MRTRISAIAMILLLAVAAGAQTDVVVYSDDGYVPYAYKHEGRAAGIYAEILRKAFAKMEGYNVRIEAVPWKRGLSYLEKGTGFALFPPYKFPTERPYIKRYSAPLLDEQTAVFCRSDLMAQPRPKWPDDYLGLKVGINAGYRMGGDRFWDAVEAGQVKLHEANSNRDHLVLLARRRTDCYLNERRSVLWGLKRLAADGDYDGPVPALVEGATVSAMPSYMAYTDRDEGRFPFKEDFAARFDAALEEMRKSGELQRVADEFMESAP